MENDVVDGMNAPPQLAWHEGQSRARSRLFGPLPDKPHERVAHKVTILGLAVTIVGTAAGIISAWTGLIQAFPGQWAGAVASPTLTTTSTKDEKAGQKSTWPEVGSPQSVKPVEPAKPGSQWFSNPSHVETGIRQLITSRDTTIRTAPERYAPGSPVKAGHYLFVIPGDDGGSWRYVSVGSLTGWVFSGDVEEVY